MKSILNISSFKTIVAALCLTIVGMAFVPLLPLKLHPSAVTPSISVSYGMNGTSKNVESEMTSRLEALFSRIKGLQGISSTSRDGWGQISLRFDKHADMEAVRFEVSTIIRQAWRDMPESASYPSISMQRSSDEHVSTLLSYSINAIANGSEIISHVERVYQNAFSDIKEIKKVEISGAMPMLWRLAYDSQKLEKLGITADYVNTAISNYRHTENLGEFVLTTDIADSTFNMSEIYITLPDSSIIDLSRVATMKYEEAKPWHITRINGLTSIYMEFQADESANQLALRKAITQRVEELREKLPVGYELHIVSDATETISEELDKIYYRSGLTVLILLLFIYITTLSWRHVTVVTCSLICNLAIAFIFYYLFDVELQLYSLAGITISLNLIIDNTIIMADHWRREHNITAILPILAATLTTIGALSVVFFLDERTRLNLADFAIVLIVNLSVSVLTALFLVPSLLEMLGTERTHRYSTRRKRIVVKMTWRYDKMARVLIKRKKWVIIAMIWAFGVPLFMMPEKIESDNMCAKAYNAIFDTETYRSIKKYTNAIFGGALYQFVNTYANHEGGGGMYDVVLTVNASLPYGSTISQMDYLVRKMESYIGTFKEVRQFRTLLGAENASIEIYFTKEAGRGSFPYKLQAAIVNKALQLGGGSWSVYGLPDNGFNNSVRESAGSYELVMTGYNYEKLQECADSVRQFLLSHKRIKEVEINSRRRHSKSDYREYHLVPIKERLAANNISASYLFYALKNLFVNDQSVSFMWNGNKRESITIHSIESDKYDIWSLLNRPVEMNGVTFKIGELCTFEKQQAPDDIVKENQQYVLHVQYSYIGSPLMGTRVSQAADSIYTARLPLGYNIEYSNRNNYYYFGYGSDTPTVWLLCLVVAIIIFITAILFNSLRLPLVIIAIVPISYVGLFLTFWIFKLAFDQGCFAAFILLCGITVNASIYIVNEYKKTIAKHRIMGVQAYIKAFNRKIVPIMLTILSTALGFIPFMIGGDNTFWFTLAAGTIGGLMASIVGIVFILPALCCRRREIKRVNEETQSPSIQESGNRESNI